MDPKIKWIWPPETGIMPIADDAIALAASEIPGIRAVWIDQRERLKGTRQLVDFSERLAREWAIETGIIENLYEIERGVTQTLIERGFQAELLGNGATNRPRDYVMSLLRDQKDALEGVFDFVANRRSISTSYIKELHSILLRSQTTTEAIDSAGKSIQINLLKGTWKERPNSPSRDDITYGYCPPEQVASEMDRLVEFQAEHEAQNVPAEVRAAWLHHRFTQIHPFQDGNGRVARAIASLVLVKDGLFPLVLTRDDKSTYLDALEAADGGQLKPLVDLIARLQRTQFRKATAISESLLTDQSDLQALLGGLMKAANEVAEHKVHALRAVFVRAEDIINDLESRLSAITHDVLAALRKINAASTCRISLSTEGQTDYYFRSQIIENAKHHLHYFADVSDFRSWISLDMAWDRRARLVFSIHGIGRPFSGSLTCAPFLEFRDLDDDGQVRATLVPVADEGFVFFHTDAKESMLGRFGAWRERVIKVAMAELIQNL